MKKIGFEVTRRYVVEVADTVDTADCRGLGVLLASNTTPPNEVEVLAWDLPDGDLYGQLSDENYEKAYNRRTLQAVAELDAHMALRAKKVL